MKKILFISSMETAPWGGSEELWSQAAARMASQKFKVSVSVKGWPETPKQIDFLELAECVIFKRHFSYHIINRIKSKIYGRDHLYNCLDHIRPDIVVISQGSHYEGIDWMEACLKRQIPYVSITHLVMPLLWSDDDTLVMRAMEVYTKARRCYFVSKKSLEDMETYLALKLENAQVVCNPFNVSYNKIVSWPPIDQENNIKLACIGRLEFQKGHDLLLKVLRIPKWRNRNIEVSLFGGGDKKGSVMRLIKYWNLNNVKAKGFNNNVEDIFRNHHALILPSRFEGMPIVVVEAMLCGRPCIATDIGGITEIITDNINGFIIKAPTAELLDETMERAWVSRKRWQEMGRLAAESIKKLIPEDPVGLFVEKLKEIL